MTTLSIGGELPAVVLPVTPDVIRAFSALAKDRNATHYDDEIARAQGFAGALVHGALTMSVALRVLTGNGRRRFARDDDVSLTFLVPVSPGDTLTGRALVTATDPQTVTFDVWCENQDGAKVLAGQARLRHFA
jgi:acyl dehydratase